MYQIVLASKSPRRIDLLKEIGVDFVTYSPEFEEFTGEEPEFANTSTTATPIPPEEIALRNSLGKAKEASNHFQNSLVIGVDTIGESHGHILGKPKDKEDAARLLRLLSGTTHSVISAITIINTISGKTVSQATKTKVTIDKLDEAEIAHYIASGEGEDKAASYAIQGLGALFVSKIEGDYFNVVGLPIYTLKKLLKEFKVDLTKTAK